MLYMVPYLATKGGGKMSFIVLTDADSAGEAKSLAGAIVKLHGKARPEFNLDGMFKPFVIAAPEVDDLPEEDTVDFGWFERYEVADDKKSFIPLHQQDHEDNAGADETSRTTEKPQVVQEQQKPAGDAGASGSEKMLAHQPLGDSDLPSHNQEPRAYFAKMSAGTRKVAVLMHGFGVIDMVLTKAQMKEVIVTSLDKGDLYYSTMLDALRLPAIDIMGPEQFASFVAGVGRRFEKGDPDVNLTSVRNFVTQILATENFEESYTSAVKPVEELPRTSSGALASTGAKPANGRPINNFEELRTVTYLAHYPADFNVSNPPGAIINAINEAKKRKDKSPETWFGQLRETPGVMTFSFEAVNTLIRNAPENLYLTPGALRTYINSNLIEIEAQKNVKAQSLPPGAADVLADDQPTNETLADSADNAGDTAPTAQGELATGAENIASNDGEKQEVATEQESDPPRRIKIRDAILSVLSGETNVMSADEAAELLTYVGEGISHSYLARLLAKEIEPCDPFQQLTDDQIHHLTFDALEQWMDDKEARCQLINERVELYLSENTSNEGEKAEVATPSATNSTASDFQENEDLTTENVREFLETSTNQADLSGETAQLSGENVTPADPGEVLSEDNATPIVNQNQDAQTETIVAPATAGIYYDVPNPVYHSGPGVSKSQLDDVAISPAVLLWRKNAPVDTEKLKALDMGSALHCLLLEPDEFNKRFIIAPEFNRRTNAGKAEEAEFLEACANTGKTVMDAEQGRKLSLMRDSAMAHPGAKFLLEGEGRCEASIYWNDQETGELCRIRPDKFLTTSPLIIDVKKVADMSRFSRHIEEFRYHVQAAMYCEGFKAHFSEVPKFAFLAVSETIDCGRYPVRLFVPDDNDIDEGFQSFRRDLTTYHQCRTSNNWGLGFENIQRPYWARS